MEGIFGGHTGRKTIKATNQAQRARERLRASHLRPGGKKDRHIAMEGDEKQKKDGKSDPLSGKIRKFADMTINEAQQSVDRWIKTYGVRYFSELTNMAVLTEEVGELARVMARRYGDQSFKAGETDNLGEEMADILWVLCCLANQTGVDLTEAFSQSLEKKTRRDAERHKNNPKLRDR